MNKAVLVELIEHLHQFDAAHKEQDDYTLRDFVGYLNAQTSGSGVTMRKIEGGLAPDLQPMRQEHNTDIGILITLMFRYAKGYIKKALKDSPIQTSDEFAFLITLMTYESLTKTELINKQVMEKTSGVEVIKRLLQQGMLREFADDTDKRSVRVAITPKGKGEIYKVLPEMFKVSKLVTGNLSESEINTLGYLLKKLDLFHNDIYQHKRGMGLEELLLQGSK
jgi:DNA-binding MarR family transcriptional regulator